MAASGTSEDFRTMLARMERDGHLRRIKKPIRPEYITALCGQAPAALMCDAVEGYDIPVVGGLFWTRGRIGSALGWRGGERGGRFGERVERVIEKKVVNTGCYE